MKKLTIVMLTACLSVSGLLASNGKKKPLEGSYPIVLQHGILGFDDTEGLFNGLLKYWGGVDDSLRDQGAEVLTPGVGAVNGVDVRSEQLKNQMHMWMAAKNFTKVHVIAHSQGGLDTRYMLANRNASSSISTLTTVNSVHRGSPIADIVLGIIPDWLEPSAAGLLNGLAKMVYGDEQDVLAMAASLSVANLGEFNNNTPNHPDVKYYSNGSSMSLPDPIQHTILFLLQPITCLGGLQNGQGCANDGVVPLSSQKWGTWKGEPSTPFYATGVDHLQATNFSGTGQLWYDVEGYYLDMAKNAKANQ